MARKKGRNSERHHYVPQFYLRNWCLGNQKFWVWLINGEKPPFLASPNSFALEKGLYAPHDLYEGEFDPEAWLGTIEDLFAPRWPSIFHDVGNLETKLNLSRYLALQYLRHPSRISKIRNRNKGILSLVEGLDQGIEFVEMQAGEESFTYRREDVVHDLNNEDHVKIDFQLLMRTSVNDLAEILAGMKWGVIKSEEPYFVTSDNPISIANPIEHRKGKLFGFSTPGTEIRFPLSPFELLIIGDSWPRDGALMYISDIDPEIKKEAPLNISAIANAERAIFSATPEVPGIPEWK